MRKLNTIQKHDNMNEIYAIDKRGIGNVNHHYSIMRKFNNPLNPTKKDSELIGHIMFQNGPREEIGSTAGVLDVDLLEIVRDRLKGFCQGEFAVEETTKALEHIEIALMYMNKRISERAERGVLGTNKK